MRVLVLIAFGVVFCGVSAHGVIDCCWILILYMLWDDWPNFVLGGCCDGWMSD